MARLIVAIALLGAIGLTLPALAADEPQTQTLQQPQAGARDGRWLRNGIREYQRYTNRAASADGPAGLAAAYYIRGVLDELTVATLRARVQDRLLNESNNTTDPKAKLGMRADYDFFAPLWKSGFVDSDLQADQCMQMISNYLDAHPEKWNLPAIQLIEQAMLAAFPPKTE